MRKAANRHEERKLTMRKLIGAGLVRTKGKPREGADVGRWLDFKLLG